jgi:hypothetical protein
VDGGWWGRENENETFTHVLSIFLFLFIFINGLTLVRLTNDNSEECGQDMHFMLLLSITPYSIVFLLIYNFFEIMTCESDMLPFCNVSN